MLVDQRVKCGGVSVHGLRVHAHVFFTCRHTHNRLKVIWECVVSGSIYGQGKARSRFVDTGSVVVGSNLVETHGKIDIRSRPFGGIEDTCLERGQNLASGQVDRDDAKLVQHVRAETWNSHFQPVQVIDRVDFLAEPTPHVGAAGASQKATNAEAGVEFVPKGLPAAVLNPGIVLRRRQAARNRAKEGHRTVLRDPVVGRVVAAVGDAVANGIERLKSRHKLSSGVEFDGEATVRHLGDGVGDPLRAHADGRQIARPTRDHAPLDPVLGDCRRGESAAQRSPGARGGGLQETSAFHFQCSFAGCSWWRGLRGAQAAGIDDARRLTAATVHLLCLQETCRWASAQAA